MRFLCFKEGHPFSLTLFGADLRAAHCDLCGFSVVEKGVSIGPLFSRLVQVAHDVGPSGTGSLTVHYDWCGVVLKKGASSGFQFSCLVGAHLSTEYGGWWGFSVLEEGANSGQNFLCRSAHGVCLSGTRLSAAHYNVCDFSVFGKGVSIGFHFPCLPP